MMMIANTDRSTNDSPDSRSEPSYNVDYEVTAESFNCNSSDPITKRLNHAICTSNGVEDMDQLDSLKYTTKKLLCVLEDVQAKTHSTALVHDDPPKMGDVLRSMANRDRDSCDIMDRSVTEIIGCSAIKRLEKQTQDLESIVITDEEDDCSVYRRLIRKCFCLNQQEYNDFIIHFNEQTKFCTNSIGEIIKNMFILKKFLYIGGKYTKNALLFLNQGLEEGTQSEKADIIQACAFADVCCVFDTYTIVKKCISWPCQNPNLVGEDTLEMTAKLLYNLSRLEEGRRYLNFNAKIICDIKKVLKKRQDKLSCDTVDMLNSVLNTCQPQTECSALNSLTYHCRPLEEGIGNKNLNALMAYRQHMTLNELCVHLDILKSLSGNEETRMQLTPHLPLMLTLFKNMLLEFNNSDINILITHIMNNMVGDSVAKKRGSNERESATGGRMTSCIATEPIKMKNVTIQVPVQKKSYKKDNQSRSQLIRKSEHKKINRSRLLSPIRARINKSEQKEINRSSIMNPILAAIKKSEQKEINRSRIPKTTAIKKSELKELNRSRKLNPIISDAITTTNKNVFQKRNTVTINFAAFHKPNQNVFQRELPFINRSRKFITRDIIRNIIVVPMEEEKKSIM